MSFFIDDKPFRVNFPDGQWCDIKQEFSQLDLDYIASKMIQANIAADSKTAPETKLNLVFGRQATLDRGIVAWSFTDDAGKTIPVTSENISNLRPKYRSVILTEVDRLTKEANAFTKNS